MNQHRSLIRLALVAVGVAISGALGSHESTAAAAGSVNTWTCSVGDTASGCAASTISVATVARSAMGVAEGSDNTLYAVGGFTGSATYTGANRDYDPTTNTWYTNKKDGTSRAAGAMVAYGAALYWAGGLNGNGYLNKMESFSLGGNSWTGQKSLPTPRSYPGGAIGADGMFYVVGGYNGSYLSTVEAFSFSGNAWYCSTSVTGCSATATPPVAMPTPRSDFALVEDTNGLLYAIGGQTGASTYTNVVEAYNPTTRIWTCSVGDTASGCSSRTLAPMPTARAVDADVNSAGDIFLAGGSNGTNVNVLEVYNPTSNSWACSTGDSASGCTLTTFSPLPTPRSDAGVGFAYDGQLYVIGGYNGAYLTTVEAYNPPTVPGTPTGVTAVAGNGTATVSWTTPVSTGGMSLTGYTITCTPSCGSVAAGASATAAVVNGLTNGTAYTFSLVANNFMGSSPASTSAAVTPAACSSGTPTLAGAVPSIFPATTINGSDQTQYTSMTNYAATDNACGGWNVTVQATGMACTPSVGNCPSGGDHLPSGSMTMAAPTVSCATGTACIGVTAPPNLLVPGNTAIDSGTAVKVASAAVNTGDGTYTFTPGDVSGAGTSLSLAIPSYVYSTTYSSTVTVSIVSGP